MKVRDQQRAKVYRAENAVNGFKDPEWRDLESCRKFLNELRNDRVLNRWYPKLKQTIDKVELHPGMGRRKACCEYGWNRYTIKLPLWARGRMVVCHELAHALIAEMYGRNYQMNGTHPGSVQAHGWQFARMQMFFIQRGVSKAKADELKASYKKHGVRFQQPKPKRQLSPERKAELQERMKKMHEAKKAKKEGLLV
jgi:hypothetical protein